jgi:hypothetical protein
LFEVVHEQHHALLRHARPSREIGEPRPRSAVDVHEERGVTGARVGEPALVQAGHHLGAEHARGLEQQAGQIGFAHDASSPIGANINLVDRETVRSNDDDRVRPARREYDETGRVTALAYREFADGES